MAKIKTAKPLFIMLYGYPGSGKTHFARQLCEHIQAAHVQGDRIRSELFEKPRYDTQENAIVAQLTEYMVGEFLNAGVSIVYDTNAMRSSQRHAFRELARKAGAQPILIWFQVDQETSFARSMKRDRRRQDDRYAMPMDRSTFDAIAARMQNPTMTEQYVVVSGKHVFSTQLSALLKRLQELNLVNSNDLAQSVVKPGLVNLVPKPNAGRVDSGRRNVIIR